jgi:hypothetical protein
LLAIARCNSSCGQKRKIRVSPVISKF